MTHGIVVLDKPCGPTSHDMVAWLRYVLRTRSVGHAGTLDPMATGVLVLGVGEGTKLLHHLTGADKAYVATLRLGMQTDSLDAQGRAVDSRPVPEGLTLAGVQQVAQRFVGEQRQRIPEISAVKVDGERLYARARRGEVVVAPEREVIVHELDVLRVTEDEVELHVRCGKGFYVRALARDLAQALGTVGHLTALRRTHSGVFSLADAVDVSSLRERTVDVSLASERVRQKLLPLAAALRDCPRRMLNAAGLVEVRHGRPVRPEHWGAGASATESGADAELSQLTQGQQPIALLDEQGALRALGRFEGDRIVVVRGITQA